MEALPASCFWGATVVEYMLPSLLHGVNWMPHVHVIPYPPMLARDSVHATSPSQVKNAALAMEEDFLKRWHPEEEIVGPRSKKDLATPLRFARNAAALDPCTSTLPWVPEDEQARYVVSSVS